MPRVALIGTRKGLFTVQQREGAWVLDTPPHFLAEPVSAVLADPRDGSWTVALRLGHFGVKLHRSTDQGRSWQALGTPALPKPAQADAAALSLDQVWTLAAGGADEPGVLWAGAIPAGLFRSADHGATWTLVHSLWDRPERSEWLGGGYDHAGIHSICVDPRDSRHLTLAISCGGVWQSHDGGTSWQLTAAGMRAEYMPPELAYQPNTQDPHRMVQCAAQPEVLWVQHHNGVFRSTDGAAQWQEIEPVLPAKFGFAVAVHPQQPDTAWFVPAMKDQYRVPVDARLVVNRTRDGGRGFEALSQGLPPVPAYDLVYRHGLAVDASGHCLVMGSTTGGLWLSQDQGDHWHCVSAHLPPIYCVAWAQ